MERLMLAQNSHDGENFMAQFLRTQKRTIEINPHHPLIQGLLEKAEEVQGDDVAEGELKEILQTLWDTSMVRSGFTIREPSAYVKH